MVIKKRISINTIYSVLIALAPVLSIYATFIDGIYLNELFLIILTGVSIVVHKKNNYYQGSHRPIIFLAFAIVVSCIMNVLFQYGQTEDVFVRSIRMLFCIVCICYTSRRLFSLDTAIKAAVYISIFAVAFIIFQTIIYKRTGLYIKGTGNILPLAYREDFDYQYYMAIMFRPSSIFLEPSGMCQYMLAPLAYVLLSMENSRKKNIVIAVILSIGILMTTSLWGLVILVFIWSIWMIKIVNVKRYFLILAIMVPVILYITINSAVFSSTMSRIDITNFDTLINSPSFSGRFFGYESVDGLDTFEKLFGMGYGNLGIRKDIGTGNSIVYYLLGLGYVGTGIFLILCLITLKRIGTMWQRTIFFAMLFLSFGAGVINTGNIVYYYTISVSVYALKENKALLKMLVTDSPKHQ